MKFESLDVPKKPQKPRKPQQCIITLTSGYVFPAMFVAML